MRALKKIAILIICFVVFLGLGSFSSRAAEDSFDDKLVSDYGIPETVLQVICDNSYLANGARLSSVASPQTLTLGDIKNLQVFSVATRKLNEDGSYTSSRNPIVAEWVSDSLNQSLELWNSAQNGGAITEITMGNTLTDFIFIQNLSQAWNNTTNTPEYLLSNGIKLDNGTVVALPKLNALLAIAGITGENLIQRSILTTIDFTGVLSEVKITNEEVSGLRTKFLALLRTKKLLNLTTLNLGSNQIGLDFVKDKNSSYVLANSILNSSSIRNLDLTNNEIQEVDFWLLKNISGSLNKLDLSNNKITKIEYSNGNYFDQILDEVSGATSINITGNAKIDFSDPEVRFVLISAVNSKGQNVSMDDSIANKVILAGLNKYTNGLTADGLLTIVDQMTADTFTKVIASDSIGGSDATSLVSKEVLEALINQPTGNNIIAQLKNNGEQGVLDHLQALAEKVGMGDELKKFTDAVQPPEQNSIVLSSDPFSFGETTIENIQDPGYSINSTVENFQLTGKIIQGYSLEVFASPWANSSDATMSLLPIFNFSLANAEDGLISKVELNSATNNSNPVQLLNNSDSAAKEFSYSLGDSGQVKLSNIDKNAQPGTYQGTITWEISTDTSNAQ